MKRRLLTATQTELMQTLRETLERRAIRHLSITEILTACISEISINHISARLSRMHAQRQEEKEIEEHRKSLKVYVGSVRANGLPYRAIVAVGNKPELKDLLHMTQKQINQWKLSSDLIQFEAAIRSPRTFFGMDENKKGRPCIDNYIALTNVLPIKTGGLF